MTDTLTVSEVATLWALSFDPAEVADVELCRWRRGHACEQAAEYVVHCRHCGGTRIPMCDEHSVVITGEWLRVAARGLEAYCADCPAKGGIYDTYVLHKIGGC
jgi:hypothetical protein